MATTRRHERRAGQTLVLSCVVVPVLCCIAAIAIDVGSLCNSRSRLQNAADAASLAGVLELWDQRAGGNAEETARAGASAEIDDVVGVNYPESGTAVAFGLWNSGTFTEVGTARAANAVRVRTRRSADAPGGADRTVFAGLFGVAQVPQQREAIARFRPGRLLPFAVWEGNITPVGTTLTMYDNDLVVPGAFGLLDFNGGANSAADLIEWTDNGYPGQVWIPPDPGYLIFEGSTGWVASLNVPIDDHIKVGDVVTACIYRNVWGTGENTYFQIVGFVKLIITSRGMEKVNGVQTKFVRGTSVGKYIVGTGETEGTMRDFMGLQLVH